MGGHRRTERRVGRRVAVAGVLSVVAVGAVVLANTGDDPATLVTAAGEPAAPAISVAPAPQGEGLPDSAPRAKVAKPTGKKGKTPKAAPLPLIPGIGGGSPLSTPLLAHPTGHYLLAPGTDAPAGPGKEVRYLVEVEGG